MYILTRDRKPNKRTAITLPKRRCKLCGRSITGYTSLCMRCIALYAKRTMVRCIIGGVQ